MLLVADNFQITHPAVQSALLNGDAGPLGGWIRRMDSAGARMIDVNTGPLGKGAAGKMTFLVEALDAKGRTPPTADERLALAVELHQACMIANVSQERLIIDPLVTPLLWEDGREQNRAVLEVIRTLPDVLGYDVRTIAGLSNLTAGIRFQEQQVSMECAYVAMLAASGLDMVLLNIFHEATVRTAQACDALLSEKVFSWEAS